MRVKTYQYQGFIYSYLRDGNVVKHQAVPVNKPGKLIDIHYVSFYPMKEEEFEDWVRYRGFI